MDDARRKAMLTELLFFKFFISGAIWERENQKFIENAASGPHPDYPDFPAQDIPIFLDPEIMELFQQTAGVQYRVQSRSN
ncbi:MAG TPA: hypothetical protein VJP79_02210 [Nitrososphaera sp.]|nr:hypothetical protein [Nitrososphaera sp.]